MPRDLRDLTIREAFALVQKWDGTVGEDGVACLRLEGWERAPILNVNGQTFRLTDNAITVEDVEALIDATSTETVNATLGLKEDGTYA